MIRNASFVTGLIAAAFVSACSSVSGERSTAAPSVAGKTDELQGSPAIGINLNWPVDWSAVTLFADAMKTSRRWQDPETGSVLTNTEIDANGWPKRDAAVLVFAGRPSNNSGTYALSFSGRATVSGASISSESYDAATNTSRALVSFAGGDTLQLTFTNTQRTAGSPTNSGVTNVKLMRPTSPGASTPYAASTLFANQELALLSKFQVLRFMDFFATNDNPSVAWQDRTLPGYATQQRESNPPNEDCTARSGICLYGAAYEYGIALSNQLGKDFYVTIPAGANDDYVSKLAKLIKYGSDGVNPYSSPQTNPLWAPLNPGLKVYVEYSNEVWNGGFSNYDTNFDAACQSSGGTVTFDGDGRRTCSGAGSSIVAISFDGTDDGDKLAARRSAARTVEISYLFRQVFGDGAMPGTSANPVVRPLLESQLGWAAYWLSEQMHQLEDYYNNPYYTTHAPLIDARFGGAHAPSYYVWGAGGSAYYSPDNEDPSLNLSNIWSSLDFDTANWSAPVQDDTNFTLPVVGQRVAYEGGPGLDSCGCAADAVKEPAWNDPRMTSLVTSHQSTWNQNGGGLLVYYQQVGDYQWGFTHDDSVLSTPKLTAIDQINGSSAAVGTYGVAIPSTIAAANFNSPLSYLAPDPSALSLDQVEPEANWTWLGYVVRSSSARAFSIALNAGSVGSGNQAEVYLDGALVGTIAIPNTGDNTNYQVSGSVGTPVVAAGTHGLLVKVRAGSFGFDSILVQ